MTTASVPSSQTSTHTSARRRSPISVIGHQVRFDLRTLVRNRQAQIFTLGMPVAFLVLFVAIFGNQSLVLGGHPIKESTYYVGNLTAFGIIDVAFMTLAISLVEVRESGILMRRRATPQPAWAIIGARAVTAVITAASTGALLLIIGRFAYGASVPVAALPSLAVAVIVGSLAFCGLGFAATTVIRSSQSAQPVVMAMALPLFFISGVFVPWPFIPPWLHQVAVIFPVRHLALAVLAPFTGHAAQGSWSLVDLLAVGAWGVAGLTVALRRFKWSPQDS